MILSTEYLNCFCLKLSLLMVETICFQEGRLFKTCDSLIVIEMCGEVNQISIFIGKVVICSSDCKTGTTEGSKDVAGSGNGLSSEARYNGNL